MDRHVDQKGYARVKDTEGIYGKKDSWVPEHRLVMAKFLGFPLPGKVHVHHINGNKSDNRVENLAIVSNMGHRAIHTVSPTKTIIERECYDPDFAGKEKWLKMRCPVCDKIFYRPASQVNRKTTIAPTCSHICAQRLIKQLLDDREKNTEIWTRIEHVVICEFKANGRFMRDFVKHPRPGFEINDRGLYVRSQYSREE